MSTPRNVSTLVITKATSVLVREPVSRREYEFVSIHTDGGVTGLGESRPPVVAGPSAGDVLEAHLVGQDARSAEAVAQHLKMTLDDKHAHLAAAVNMALLDIMGKLAGAPIHQVLGGPTRTKARAFAHIHGSTTADLTESLHRARQSGHRAFLVPLSVGASVTRGRAFYRRVREQLDSLRQAAGEHVDFVLDPAGRLSPAEAAGLARELESFHLLWLDEPCGRTTNESLRKISDQCVTPIGLGRKATRNGSFQEWLREDVIDVIRPDVAQLGITGIRKAAALAETYYVAVAPFHRGGPVATAATLHLAASIPNFFIQELPTPADERDVHMRRSLTIEPVEVVQDGFLSLPTAPGLGVTLNEDAVDRYRVGAGSGG